MPTGKAQIYFGTGGYSSRVVSTTSFAAYAITAKNASAYFATISQNGFATTSKNAVALFATISGNAFITTSAIRTAYFVTPDPNTQKDLILKIGTLSVDSDYTYLNVPDATGDYNALTNTGGYNVLPAPYNPYRPYRLNVRLWTVYKIWNVYGSATQSPDQQNDQDEVNYVYQLEIPTVTNPDGTTEIIGGVYEIILIAAPYFNESFSGGTYKDDDNGTYRIVDGTDTTFTSLAENDYLYFVNGGTGALQQINQVDKVFSDTQLNLTGAPINTAFTGYKLYGSANAITGVVSSGGEVSANDGYTSGLYSELVGNGTQFVTNGFNYLDYIYYIDPTNGDYIPMGQVLEVTGETTLNLFNTTATYLPPGTDPLVKSASLVENLINSDGYYDSDLAETIYGVNTDFTKFEVGQTLYAQDVTTFSLTALGIIDSIVSETEVILQAAPPAGTYTYNRLFASNDPFVVFNTSDGTFGTYSLIDATFNLLKGFGTSFQTNFSVDDYIYIVALDGTYKNLGQVDYILSETEMVFYAANSIEVNANEWIYGRPTPLALINLTGTFDEYNTGTFYSIEGDGTTFLTTFEKDQYLFYLDANTGNYVYMGQIFQIYDNTHVWLEQPMDGNVTTDDGLYSSWSLNTYTADYSTFQGNPALDTIAKETPGWYIDTVGILLDNKMINCINRMRYEFLQQVMCGKCYDEYLEIYSLYTGMINAIDIQEWANAVALYNKIKQMCDSFEQGCNC
jgi:hypothetical protein